MKKIKNVDLMLDLETFGTNINAVIVQIGACYFDRYTGEIGETFLENIDAETSVKEGFEMDASTVYWWMSQNKDAIESVIKEPRNPVKKVIKAFNNFASRAVSIWSHATFDFVILMNHFRTLDIKPKFHYRTARDLRTLVDLADIKYKNQAREGIHHNALDDCIFQVEYAVKCFNKLRIDKC